MKRDILIYEIYYYIVYGRSENLDHVIDEFYNIYYTSYKSLYSENVRKLTEMRDYLLFNLFCV